jgi:hypothetical protein
MIRKLKEEARAHGGCRASEKTNWWGYARSRHKIAKDDVYTKGNGVNGKMKSITNRNFIIFNKYY